VQINLTAAENGFIKNLQSATAYKSENNRLLLFNPAGEVLKFKKTD
jgi:heat shock protein HslJ